MDYFQQAPETSRGRARGRGSRGGGRGRSRGASASGGAAGTSSARGRGRGRGSRSKSKRGGGDANSSKLYPPVSPAPTTPAKVNRVEDKTRLDCHMCKNLMVSHNIHSIFYLDVRKVEGLILLSINKRGNVNFGEAGNRGRDGVAVGMFCFFLPCHYVCL